MPEDSKTIEGIMRFRDEMSAPLDRVEKKIKDVEATTKKSGAGMAAAFTKSAIALQLLFKGFQHSAEARSAVEGLTKTIGSMTDTIVLSVKAAFGAITKEEALFRAGIGTPAELVAGQFEQMKKALDAALAVVPGLDKISGHLTIIIGNAKDLAEANAPQVIALKVLLAELKTISELPGVDATKFAGFVTSIEAILGKLKGAKPVVADADAAFRALAKSLIELEDLEENVATTMERRLKGSIERLNEEIFALFSSTHLLSEALAANGINTRTAADVAGKHADALRDERDAAQMVYDIFKKTGDLHAAELAGKALIEARDAAREYEKTWESIARNMEEVAYWETQIETNADHRASSFAKGWEEGITVMESARDVGRAVAQEMQSAFSSIFEGLLLEGRAFQDILKDILKSIARLFLNQAAGLFAGAFGSALGITPAPAPVPGARGAIFPGHFEAFARGSPRVNRPTLGLIGEGSRPEAVVPLPDGHSIPVEMRGGGGSGGQMSITIYAMDSQDVIRALNRPDVKRFLNGNTTAGFSRDTQLRNASRAAG